MAFTQVGSYPTAGIYTEQLASVHDVMKPQHVAKLFARFGAQYLPMFGILASMGRESAVAGDEWFGHEENWYHRTIKVAGSTAAGAAGQSVDITIAADHHNSLGGSYPRVGEIISLKDGNFSQARIEAKDETVPNAHVLTIKSAVSTKSIPAIADGTILSITNAGYGAGTGQPLGATVGATRRDFVAQIFKETIGTEGTQLVNEKWFKETDNGKNIGRWYSPGYLMAEYRLGLKIDGAYLWGEESDNLIVPQGEKGAGNKVKLTKGAMRHVSELGKELQYAQGAFDPEDLDQVGLYLKSQGITSGYVMVWTGAKLGNDIENGLVDYLGQHSAPDYTNTIKNVFKGDDDLAVTIGFNVIKKGGITFILKPMDAWSNPMTYGATGYDMDTYGLVTPLAKFTDAKSRKVLDNISTRYRSLNGYNRKFEAWDVGGAGPGRKVTEFDETNTFLRGHHGLQLFKANQMMIMKQ